MQERRFETGGVMVKVTSKYKIRLPHMLVIRPVKGHPDRREILLLDSEDVVLRGFQFEVGEPAETIAARARMAGFTEAQVIPKQSTTDQ